MREVCISEVEEVGVNDETNDSVIEDDATESVGDDDNIGGDEIRLSDVVLAGKLEVLPALWELVEVKLEEVAKFRLSPDGLVRVLVTGSGEVIVSALEIVLVDSIGEAKVPSAVVAVVSAGDEESLPESLGSPISRKMTYLRIFAALFFRLDLPAIAPVP